MERILYHGRFPIAEHAGEPVTACLVREGRFIALGTDEEILALADGNTERIDLKGATALPGMIDSHLHILGAAISARQLTLNNCRDRGELLQAVRERAERLPEGACVDGRGFNEDLWPDPLLPTREELDEAGSGHPVRLTRICGHMVLANSAAMALAGIDADTPQPTGGRIDFALGRFSEDPAIDLLFCDRKDAGVEACMDLLRDGMALAARGGLTGIWSDDLGTGGFSAETVIEAYRRLDLAGEMPVRVVQQCAIADPEEFRRFAERHSYLEGDDFYRIGPRKLYADGSLGARTAWITGTYADAPGTSGVPIYTREELIGRAVASHQTGFPFIVHAIGDAAADLVLDCIDAARSTVPGTDSLRSGIVHCQITRADQLKRIAETDACIYAQPIFTEYDLHICADRVGAERERTSYAWRTLKDAGVPISSGSDCPVEPLDAAKNLYCAVTRKDLNGFPEGGWTPEERLTFRQAVQCHTEEAAYDVCMEDRLGRIREGYLADLSVYREPLDLIPADELRDAELLFTVSGGRIVKDGRIL